MRGLQVYLASLAVAHVQTTRQEHTMSNSLVFRTTDQTTEGNAGSITSHLSDVHSLHTVNDTISPPPTIRLSPQPSPAPLFAPSSQNRPLIAAFCLSDKFIRGILSVPFDPTDNAQNENATTIVMLVFLMIRARAPLPQSCHMLFSPSLQPPSRSLDPCVAVGLGLLLLGHHFANNCALLGRVFNLNRSSSFPELPANLLPFPLFCPSSSPPQGSSP